MILLKFEKAIKGDSKTEGFTDQITCDSVQWGVGRAVSSSGQSTDREVSNPSFSEVTFSKSTDISSSELFAQAIHGKSLGKASVTFINTHEGKPQPYMQVDLHDAIVSSYSASSGGDRPSESFSLNFTKQVLAYKQFDGDKVVADGAKGWDLRAGKEFNTGEVGK
jgi:type VI secretion system secreted protein Hcp